MNLDQLSGKKSYAPLKDGDQPGGIRHAVLLWLKYREQALELYGPIENWNTCDITDMSQLFFNATTFNDNVSQWDTGNVKDMSYMFYNARSFNGNISKWDTGNVEFMKNMFYGAESFNGDLSRWNTGNLNYMGYG